MDIQKRLEELRSVSKRTESRPDWKKTNGVMPHNRVFLLDVSSSMEGEKIECARKALERHMKPTDGLVVFGSDAGYVRRSEVSLIKAEGMTAMLPAFKIGILCKPMHFVLISDGAPNVNGREEDILEFGKRIPGVRIDCIGITKNGGDCDYNRDFLEQLAQQNGGTFQEVSDPKLLGDVVKLLCHGTTTTAIQL